ncbi:hypothetical protein [Lederbergia citrisecunda]|nr:hypothetical protein [Lederbergia citrisecunda]
MLFSMIVTTILAGLSFL